MASAPASTSPANGSFGMILVIALVLVLAWQLAYWTWKFVAPGPIAASATTSAASVDLALAARLFGATAGAGPASSSDVKLKGVIAPTPGTTASAIFARTGGKDLAVFIDGEVRPGVKLAEVFPDHVIVTRAGVRERIDLEIYRGVAAAPVPGRAGPGFRLNVARTGSNNFSFSRKELDDALRDPNQLGQLGQIGMPQGGGVRMESAPPGSLASKLGLQPGDILRKLNGQTVASPGDLARLYQQFATLTSIQAEVERGGTTVQLAYRIQ